MAMSPGMEKCIEDLYNLSDEIGSQVRITCSKRFFLLVFVVCNKKDISISAGESLNPSRN